MAWPFSSRQRPGALSGTDRHLPRRAQRACGCDSPRRRGAGQPVPDGTAPRRHNFLARNYTMAALSDVVVVVEAAEGSGALITAEAALDLHKEVMAVPGSVFSPLSVGTHGLIRDGAGLVQN
ncbi:MAG TPA: DNA-processing protein DprA, partial [Candidatus Dormibacteraeota bacterium]|nr:DNA-processing protein DprA [Candidatus Dormibacteraeota bacterium]